MKVTSTQVCEQSFVLGVCFQYDNLYGPWLVFITECEFDNTDM